ncbi:transketolase [Pendulispora albinea]|uniref:Transketolase n=1 Tax=Pendulispora albinea TaxID=2741071 RepID=A0ABZ2M7W4_9BACT
MLASPEQTPPQHGERLGQRDDERRAGLPDEERRALEALALRVREHVIRMSTRGGCFIGASLSCADLLVHLYSRVLRVRPEAMDDPGRDYLLLSKGHDVPALYGTLAELGYFPKERLRNHLRPDDYLYWHPNRAVPGIEFHSGSLGHLLSVGVGIALDVKLRGGSNRIFVVLGDGELDEGSVWEAFLVAGAKKLDNLVAIVDRNQFQANVRTEELIPLEPLEPKFRAFGAEVVRVDGHDHDALAPAFARIPRASGRPTVIVCDTVRGKGLPSIEERADRWFCNFTENEVEQLLAELHHGERARIESEGLVVR